MSLSTAEIEMVVKDLAPRLEGGTIARIDQPDKWRLILKVRRGKSRYWMQFVLHPRFSRLHLLTRRPKEGRPAGGMCRVVRQHLTGSPVGRLRQVEDDRVVVLESVERDALLRPSPVRLIAELVGPGSNLILVDGADRILGAMFTEDSKRRRIFPGETYRPLPLPPAASEKALRNHFAGAVLRNPHDELALSRAIQNAYVEMEARAEFEERRAALSSLVSRHLKALKSRQGNLREDLKRAEGAEELRRAGELLRIARPGLRKGQGCAVVEDVFEADVPERTIELDPALSPEQNIEEYFRRYKKLKASRKHVEDRLEQTRSESERMRALAREIQAAASTEALSPLEERTRAVGLLLAQERRAAGKAAGGPRRFISADGMEILVARNQRENHELTFSIARGGDCWMHVLGWEGPHVVIRKPRGTDVPLETLLDAAHLAVHYSKLRGTDFSEVVYTQCKYVRPVKGAGPGRVSYAQVSRLAVRFERGRLRRLLESRSAVRTET